jgi:hypothetical protein
MISFGQMCKKMGKAKAMDMAVKCQGRNKTKAQSERGIKGRVRYRRCDHGVWIIDDYKPKVCKKCVPQDISRPEFSPYFNAGLGHWVESRSEEKRCAKSLGLVEAG